METIACKICDQNLWAPVLVGRDMLHDLPGEFTIARCQKCGFMATNPRPDSQEIIAYYPEDYGPYTLTTNFISKKVAAEQKYPFLFSLVDGLHTQVLWKEKKNLHVLEIGCGSGTFLYELTQMHPTWQVTGTDFSQKSIDGIKAHGMNAYVSNLTKLEETDRSIDVVYGWMIVEHIHALEQALAEVRRVMKDDGRFVFAVPNDASWQFRFFGKNAYFLHLPHHLYHFTPKTITALLERHGFMVEEIVFQRTFADVWFGFLNMLKNSSLPTPMKHKMLHALRWRTLFHFVTLPFAYIQAWLQATPRMTIIAKKKV
jgi:SAM-dependent methyltransferase